MPPGSETTRHPVLSFALQVVLNEHVDMCVGFLLVRQLGSGLGNSQVGREERDVLKVYDQHIIGKFVEELFLQNQLASAGSLQGG